jgi:outer membrane protein OmpA-like peptidoglycan-associated protein
MKFISNAGLLITGVFLVMSMQLSGCVSKAPREPAQYKSSGRSESAAPADGSETAKSNREEPLSEENLRLIDELRQRGIDVRESDRGVVINLPDVLFASGRSELTKRAQEIISEISQILQRAPSRSLSVEGHTDSVGNIEYNYHLSKSRAEQVAGALQINGIPLNLISVVAFGETTPIATNRTDLGRRQNRRVEVVILK